MRTAPRVLAAAAAAAAVVVGTAGPAAAAAPEVTWRTPSAGQRFEVSGFTVDATVRMPNSGTLRANATLSFVSPENHPVPAPVDYPTNNEASKVVTQAVSFPWNGPYTVRITATGRDDVLDQTEEQGGGTADFVVEAPPAPPQNVRTAVDGQTRKVTVSWAANAEPDMVGYEVQRQLGAESWQRVTLTTKATTSVVDGATTSEGGSYRYRVFAVRQSATPNQGIASSPSATSTAKVPPPPVTTTTTTAPEDDEETSGGTGEGTTGGTTRTTTRSGSTGGSTRSGSSNGSTSGSASGRSASAPPLATTGKVDLSGFAALLEQARVAGGDSLADGEEDGGYTERLPFGARQRRTDSEPSDDEGDDGTMIVSAPIADDGPDRLQSMAFLAGGLLATVLLMHVLWVRAELRRAEALEALVPADDLATIADGQASPAAGVDPWGRQLAAALARFHARPPTRRPPVAAAPTGTEREADATPDPAVIG